MSNEKNEKASPCITERPYQIDYVGTSPVSNYAGIEISVNGVVFNCFFVSCVEELTFSENAKIIKERAVDAVGYDSEEGFVCDMLRIPANIEEIEPGAFFWLDEVHNVDVDWNNEQYKAEDDVIFTKDGKKLIYCSPSKSGDYEVPFGTEEIVAYAFNMSGLDSISIPASVKTIHEFAFNNEDRECSITEIRGIPGSVAEQYAQEHGFDFTEDR